MDDSDDSLVVALPASAVAPGIARHDVGQWLRARAVASRTIDAVILVVSELVTNSVEHTDSEPELAVICRSDTVHVAVSDNDRQGPVARIGGAAGGFGLHIVARTAQAWGWEPGPGGKVVWADIATG